MRFYPWLNLENQIDYYTVINKEKSHDIHYILTNHLGIIDCMSNELLNIF